MYIQFGLISLSPLPYILWTKCNGREVQPAGEAFRTQQDTMVLPKKLRKEIACRTRREAISQHSTRVSILNIHTHTHSLTDTLPLLEFLAIWDFWRHWPEGVDCLLSGVISPTYHWYKWGWLSGVPSPMYVRADGLGGGPCNLRPPDPFPKFCKVILLAVTATTTTTNAWSLHGVVLCIKK